ncbi:MAG: NAD-dependent epimerase/dehydratase family protein [Anaerolineae bacterium]
MTRNHRRERILLTGGSGLLGRYLAALLRGRAQVTHFDLADPGDGLPWIKGSLCDAQAVEVACQGQDVVIHAAALHGPAWQVAGDHTGFEVNVMGTHNILEGARKGGAWRVVYTSSIWATGHAPAPAPYLPIDEALPREPLELYGLTKKLGENMCLFATERYGISTICLRPGGICREDAPPQARLSHLFGTVDVRDVATAHLLALDAPDTMRHERFVITASSPLCQIAPTRFFADGSGVLEQLFPGFGRRVAEGLFTLPAHSVEWYSIAKATSLLGYWPRYGFGLSADGYIESLHRD